MHIAMDVTLRFITIDKEISVNNKIRLTIFSSILIALVGCGGGGSSSSPQSNKPSKVVGCLGSVVGGLGAACTFVSGAVSFAFARKRLLDEQRHHDAFVRELRGTIKRSQELRAAHLGFLAAGAGATLEQAVIDTGWHQLGVKLNPQAVSDISAFLRTLDNQTPLP